MNDENKIITIAVDAQTEKKLEAASARRGKSVEEYCTEAVFRELNGEVAVPQFSFEELFALSDEILQGRRSSTDSAELIREAREERHQNL